jgi:hypothetical protein
MICIPLKTRGPGNGCMNRKQAVALGEAFEGSSRGHSDSNRGYGVKKH